MITEKLKTLENLSTHPKVNMLAQQLPAPDGINAAGLKGFELQCLEHWTLRARRDIAVVGLLQFWSVAKYNTHDGVIEDADLTYIDAVVNYQGFGKAMEKVGWIKYDRKKNRLILPELRGETLMVEVKKSPGAIRQKSYRERLKMKNCLTKDITEGCRAPCNNIVQRYERVEVIPRLVHEDNGVTRFGSIVIEGVAYEVTSSPKSTRSSVTQGITANVTAGGLSVTQGITDSVTAGDLSVTQGITNSVTAGGLSVTQGITDSVTAGDLSVTPGITDSVTAGDLSVTQGITNSVTAGGLSVTQGITDSVTAGDLSVTPGITVDDLAVTRSEPAVMCSKNPSRVIPSRAHTRFSFLRSKTLRSKHKTTHTAREDNFRPVDNFQPETTHGQFRRSLHQGITTVSRRHRAGYAKNRLCEQRVSAMLNVTHSLTLLRRGNESVCLTRKQANRDKSQQPTRSRTVLDIFPMYPTWKPSADFLVMVGRLGIELHADPDYAELTEFTSYWAAGQAEHTQQQWELKLGRCLAKGRRRGRKHQQAKRDITIMPSADYAIPEGFRGG